MWRFRRPQDLWIHRSIETPRTCRLLSDPVVQLDLGTRIMICQMQHTCTGKSLEACCSKKVLPHGLKRITVYHQRLQDVFPRFCLTSSRFSKSAFQLSWFCASTGKLYVLENWNTYWLDSCCDVRTWSWQLTNGAVRRKMLGCWANHIGDANHPIPSHYTSWLIVLPMDYHNPQ